MKTTRAILAALAAFAIPAAVNADITTGWLQTDTGTYDFLDAANWANREINGVFSSDLTLSKNINIKLADNWTGSFKFYSAATYATLKIYADGGDRTIFLNDDIELACLGNEVKARLLFGDVTAIANTLTFNLGGEKRKIMVGGTSKWTQTPSFASRFANGDLVVDTQNAANRKLCFAFRGGSDGDVYVRPGSFLVFGHASDTSVDLTGESAPHRAKDLYLARSELDGGHKVNAEDIIDGAIHVGGSDPFCSIMEAKPQNTGKTYCLTAESLMCDPGALLVVRGNSLGAELSANVANVKFTNVPTLVGGILPQVIAPQGGTGGIGETYDQTFVTYDVSNGIQPLSLTDDYATAVSGEEAVNLMVPYGTTNVMTGPATVNSLYLEGKNSGTAFAAIIPGENVEDATLTVNSGMVLIGYPKSASNSLYPTIAIPLAFGSRRGMIVAAGGKRSQINGAISGTSGVTFTTAMAITDTMPTSGLVLGGNAGASTYTGDTYIQTFVNVGATGLLPHGDRTGDVYVNGILQADNFTINGLYGKGTVNRASSGTKNMFVGDNDADGDFTGTFSVTDNSSTLTKIGAGTQRFGGTVTLAANGNFNVNAGKVVLDGSVTQGAVNVAAGAAIGGNGSIATTLTFASGANLAVKVEDGVATYLDVTGAVSGGSVTVNADVTGGKWREPQCVLKSEAPINASFVAGTGISSLRLNENGTELWAMPVLARPTIISMH